MNTIREPERETPVLAEVDVCVIGGGPGGLPAALASARAGAKTLLVERYGFLGGMATAGLIGPILGHRCLPEGDAAVGGLVREFCERMAAIGEAWPWEKAMRSWGIGFSAEGFKITADRMTQEAGVELSLHTLFVDAVVEEGTLTHAVVETKSGRGAIRASVFVDATADADVARRAGAPCTKGRPADGLPMAMGSMYHLGGLDRVTPEQREAMAERLRRAVAEEGLNLYGAHLGNPGSTLAPGFHSVNHTRFGGDCADVGDLTRGELETRRQTWEVLRLLRAMPGGEALFLSQTPPMVGCRESRQIVAERVLTGDDVVAGRKHTDDVARAAYWIDIHCPRGLVERGTVHLCSTECTNRECYMLTEHGAELPTELYPPTNDYCGIPYRSLVPKGVDGLLASGRCIGADYQAMSATRVMATCMAIGEAAGVAAAMAADAGCAPRDVGTAALRDRLSRAGALV